jgi:major vault protein
MLRGAVKQLTIEEFYSDPINVIRNTILGTASDRDDAPAGRPGRLFEENGMRVYDVEVLDVEIRDQEIGSLLENAQHESAKLMLQNIREERQLEAEKRSQEIAQETLKVQKATEDLKHAHQLEREQNSLARQLAAITTEVETREADLKASRDRQALHAEIHEAKLGRDKAAEEQSLALKQKALDQTLAELEAGTKAWTAKAEAIQPELIAALQGIGDKHLLERMSENMAPMAILGGKSIQEVLGGLIKGTKLEGILMDKDNGQKALTSDRPSRH